jgi:hypothetical protein
MVVFVTSLRHPHNARNFRHVETIFERSVRSVCSQIDPEFRVVVVSNVKPQIGFDDPRIIYHVVDYPPPSAAAGPVPSSEARWRDKGTKLLAGMLLAREFAPRGFAIFDSDDVVSRRLAGLVNGTPTPAGWYIDHGYAVNCRTWTARRQSGMVRYCGTTLIPNADVLLGLANLKPGLHAHSTHQELLDGLTPFYNTHIIGSHFYMLQYFAARGLHLRRVPFRAVGWMQETGENSLLNTGIATGLPLNRAFCEEFGLDPALARDARPSPLDRLRESAHAWLSFAGATRARIIGYPAPPE